MRILASAILAFLCASSVNAFTIISNRGKPAAWKNNTTSYQFYPDTSGDFTGGHDASGTVTDEFAPIRAAFQSWTNLSGINLSVHENSNTLSSAPQSGDHVNSIRWVRTGWRSLSFRPPSNALAVTLLAFDDASGEIDEADIFFNADNFSWAVVDSGSESNYIDVQNIATHEIGHFLGLDHSSEDLFETEPELADATMYYAASAGETSRRALHDDDEKGILALYGESSRGTPSISSADIVSDSAGILTLHVKGSGFNEYTSFVITTGSASDLDYVARYRTMTSSTEATVRFDALGFNGKGTLLAINQPANSGSLALAFSNLSGASASISADSASGGGGGCSLGVSIHDQPALSPWILAAFALILFSLRLSVRVVRLKVCSTQRGKSKS